MTTIEECNSEVPTGKVIRTEPEAGATVSADTEIIVYVSSGPCCTDNDGDQYYVEGGNCGLIDCDDNDAGVNPGATEVPYNGKDDDCNAQTPDDDLDGDGYPIAT
ncbi:MAG: PASTA domain-containing protein, partial [Deltaproteobacteria bacterium]|nr:PASTA domain-containing protein [Deltaproteobacteria bacterium]